MAVYYPYFRGKQYELMLLRDFAGSLGGSDICPIIEPVKANLSTLRRAVHSLNDHNANYILIVNPTVGELKNDSGASELLEDVLLNSPNGALGILVNNASDIDAVESSIERHEDGPVAIIHSGFERASDLARVTSNHANIREHIFIEKVTGKLYRRHFRDTLAAKILIRNSFNAQRKNADYAESEYFSDLHITFPDERMNGFGDYLIVGDEFTESGGPAYAVAIHITYLSADDDDNMYIYHFKSVQNASPTNPAGKFYEALEKLVRKMREPNTNIFPSLACQQFAQLYETEHFPGLGKVKQISMQHHIELIADFLSRD